MANKVERFTAEFVASYPVPKQGRVRVREAQTPGLYLQVTRNGARSFLCDFYVNGEYRRETIGNASVMKLSDARAKCHDFREAARHGRDPLNGRAAAQVRRGAATLGEIFDAYLLYCENHRVTRPQGDKLHIEPHTLENIRSNMKVLRDEFGTEVWTVVTAGKLMKWHTENRDRPARANLLMIQFKQAWKYARKSELIPNTALSAHDLFEWFKEQQYGSERKPINLTDQGYIKLYSAIDHFRVHGDPRHVTVSSLDHIEFCSLIGQRKASLHELRWDDEGVGNFVEFEDSIPVSLVFRRKIKQRGKVNVIDLRDKDLEPVVALIQRIQKNRVVGNPYLFPCRKWPEKRTHITHNNRLLQRLCEHAGLPRMTLRDFRNSASNAGTRGGNTRRDNAAALNHGERVNADYYEDQVEAARFKAVQNRPAVARMVKHIAKLRG